MRNQEEAWTRGIAAVCGIAEGMNVEAVKPRAETGDAPIHSGWSCKWDEYIGTNWKQIKVAFIWNNLAYR